MTITKNHIKLFLDSLPDEEEISMLTTSAGLIARIARQLVSEEEGEEIAFVSANFCSGLVRAESGTTYQFDLDHNLHHYFDDSVFERTNGAFRSILTVKQLKKALKGI